MIAHPYDPILRDRMFSFTLSWLVSTVYPERVGGLHSYWGAASSGAVELMSLTQSQWALQMLLSCLKIQKYHK